MICLAGCDKTIPGVTMVLPRLNAVSQLQMYANCIERLCRGFHQLPLQVLVRRKPCIRRCF